MLLMEKGNGTQEAQKAQEGPLLLVPFVLLVFRSLFSSGTRQETCTSFRMKLTGLDIWDSSIQRTNVWLKELMQELNSTDYKKTYLILRSVLHTLRDHLSIGEAVYLGEQLPMLIRGMY